MTVPQSPSAGPSGLESSAYEDIEPAPMLLPRIAAPRRSSGSLGGKSLLVLVAGGLGILVLLVVIGIVVSNRRGPALVEDVPEPPTKRPAPRSLLEDPPPRVSTPDKSASKKDRIKLPRFPEPGLAREIEPGIILREVTLGPPDPVPGGLPGHCGRLWIDRPAGEPAAKSLPCAKVSPACGPRGR